MTLPARAQVDEVVEYGDCEHRRPDAETRVGDLQHGAEDVRRRLEALLTHLALQGQGHWESGQNEGHRLWRNDSRIVVSLVARLCDIPRAMHAHLYHTHAHIPASRAAALPRPRRSGSWCVKSPPPGMRASRAAVRTQACRAPRAAARSPSQRRLQWEADSAWA